ncbi:AurF N-oxygenase family protein [Actinomadura sediminis]|uniref:Diiron oxygenase n=1 Tax=Actinomadura sediminis TaxID=1038904 RepID=A0ABW3EII7_9ACTN
MKVKEREATARRLLRSAAKASFDPGVEIDWDAPMEPGKYFLPPERVSLYGTDVWRALDEERRIELSRHELASMTYVGVWLEVSLMQLFMRFVYDLDPRSAHAQFALTEVGDETRHSVMFGRLLDRLGAPRTRLPAIVHRGGRLYKAVGSGPAMWATFLVGEEVFDRMQRAIMDDPRVQPLVRDVSRIHVIEEARHVRFAREEIVRSMRGLGRARLAAHRLTAAVTATAPIGFMIDPEVYRCVGLEPARGRSIALANPHHRETLLWMGAKIVPFLEELGLVAGPGRALWRHTGLLR